MIFGLIRNQKEIIINFFKKIYIILFVKEIILSGRSRI